MLIESTSMLVESTPMFVESTPMFVESTPMFVESTLMLVGSIPIPIKGIQCFLKINESISMVIETEQHDTNLKHSDGKKHLDASIGP